MSNLSHLVNNLKQHQQSLNEHLKKIENEELLRHRQHIKSICADAQKDLKSVTSRAYALGIDEGKKQHSQKIKTRLWTISALVMGCALGAMTMHYIPTLLQLLR